MGKRKVTNEGNIDNISLPSPNDVLGIAVKMLGADRIMVKRQEGKERLCRVRGKLKRRIWIREGDILWRYRKNQSDWLRNHSYLKMQWRTA
jgi:translation initiation factor 1A